MPRLRFSGVTGTVLYDFDETRHVVTITYNRPDALNAINGEMRGDLNEAFGRFRDDENAWIAIVTGAGRAFCAGADIGGEGNSAGDFPGTFWEKPTQNSFESGWEIFKPVIAAVNGHCLGYGFTLVTWCDFVIASERATFGLPELLYGFVPAIVLPFLLERLPPHKLRLAGLSARTFTAAEAAQCGLADVLTSDLPGALRTAVRRFSRVQPSAIAKWKTFAAPARSAAGLDVTAGTLEDPIITKRVQTFLSEGTAPWLQDCDD